MNPGRSGPRPGPLDTAVTDTAATDTAATDTAATELPSEPRLTELLADFARVLGTDFALAATLDRLVHRTPHLLPVTGAAVLLVGDDGGLRVAASTTDRLSRSAVVQQELGDGPCLTAWRSGDPVLLPDLRSEPRFPDFARRALSHGVAAVFSLPLQLDGRRVGALNLYRDSPGALTPRDLGVGQVLAGVVSAYLFSSEARLAARDAHRAGRRRRLLHDPLTGLPTGPVLAELLDAAVRRSNRADRQVAVLVVTMDGLARVVAHHGPEVAGQVLRTASVRLRQVLRSGDTVARPAPDSFVVVCEGLRGPAAAREVAGRVAGALHRPYRRGTSRLVVPASIRLAYSGPADDLSDAHLKATGQAAPSGPAGRHTRPRPSFPALPKQASPLGRRS